MYDYLPLRYQLNNIYEEKAAIKGVGTEMQMQGKLVFLNLAALFE